MWPVDDQSRGLEASQDGGDSAGPWEGPHTRRRVGGEAEQGHSPPPGSPSWLMIPSSSYPHPPHHIQSLNTSCPPSSISIAPTLIQIPSSSAFSFLFFFRPHPRHMKVPRLGFKSELQLLAYTTATAMPDPQPTELGQGLNPLPQGH